MLQDAVRFLRTYDDILLIAHISPDGDTLGSSFALYGALLELGKQAQWSARMRSLRSTGFCRFPTN
jgi:phosphoesterase RecJ-like protein